MKFKHGNTSSSCRIWERLGAATGKRTTFNKFVGSVLLIILGFYDGPPFPNGNATPRSFVEVSTVKDTMGRFHDEKVASWAPLGLGLSRTASRSLREKTPGISNKKRLAQKISVSDYVKEWALWCELVPNGKTRLSWIGRWVEFKGAYKTMDNTTWNLFGGRSRVLIRRQIYEGEKDFGSIARRTRRQFLRVKYSYQMDTTPSLFVYLSWGWGWHFAVDYLLPWIFCYKCRVLRWIRDDYSCGAWR